MEKRVISIPFLFLLVLIPSVFFIAYVIYTTDVGSNAVYHGSFAWKVDLISVILGFYVLSLAAYLIFAKKIGMLSFAILSTIGAIISMMHIAKWIVRVTLY